MQLPSSKQPKKDYQKEEERHREQELVHSLVVKIISWKSGLMDGALITENDKISRSEWNRYEKHLINISKSQSERTLKSKLKDIYQAIEKHGGFGF